MAHLAGGAVQSVLGVIFRSTNGSSLFADSYFRNLMSFGSNRFFEHLNTQVQAVSTPLCEVLLEMVSLTEGVEACQAEEDASFVLRVAEASGALILID